MDPKLARWFAGPDRGASSEAMALYLAARVHTGAVPHDSGDFGRCYRLLKHMGWRNRIGEMTEASGRWAVLVEIWDQLEAAHERDDREELYRLIKDVEAKGFERDGYKVVRNERGWLRSASKDDAWVSGLGAFSLRSAARTTGEG